VGLWLRDEWGGYLLAGAAKGVFPKPRIPSLRKEQASDSFLASRLFSSVLQAKFVCAVQGDLNQCNDMGAIEMHRRLEQLKRRIHRVHLYSQGEAQFLKVQTLGTLSPAHLLPLCLPSHYSVYQA
jgi:hypothetical protein